MKAIIVFDKDKTAIECSNEDYIDDICNAFLKKINISKNEIMFFYRGKKITQNIKINKLIYKDDLKKNKINIFGFKIKHLSKGQLFYNKNRFKEIICPECGENCKIKFDNYKIILYECKNNHMIKDIEFENFFEMENYGKSKIKCDYCNKFEEAIEYDELYNCLECNKNLCILCKEMHNKDHKIIKYGDKNYICDKHNERYISYCTKCNKDLCLKCEDDHKNENSLIYYKDIKPDINDTNKEEMKLKIEYFINNIKDIIEKLNKTMNKIENYYKICINFVNNFK